MTLAKGLANGHLQVSIRKTNWLPLLNLAIMVTFGGNKLAAALGPCQPMRDLEEVQGLKCHLTGAAACFQDHPKICCSRCGHDD